MIYTTTFNPALDYIVDVKDLQLGMTNRTSFEQMFAGWEEQHDYAHAFRMGLAAGSASAFSEKLATREEIMKVFAQIEV